MVGGTADLKYLAIASSKITEQGSRGARVEMLACVCTSMPTSCPTFKRDWYLLMCPWSGDPPAHATKTVSSVTHRSAPWPSSHRSANPGAPLSQAPLWARHQHPAACGQLRAFRRHGGGHARPPG